MILWFLLVIEDLDVEITANYVYLEDVLIPGDAGDEYLRLIAPNDIKQIGKGETTAIVLTKFHNGTLANNNLRDILPHIMSDHLIRVLLNNIFKMNQRRIELEPPWSSQRTAIFFLGATVKKTAAPI